MLRQAWLWLLLHEAAAAPWTEENARWNINFERAHDPKSYYGKWDGHEYFPSPPDWRALSIYQLLTDRFVDGDPRNNELYEGDFDVRDMSFRHGGDFIGIRQKLPYIKGLGCRAIWISPVFVNGPNSYHQYAMHDFTLLDPRLGTLEELRALTSEAHRLGMYVIIDVVMNHMANAFAFENHREGATPFAMHETQEYKLVIRDNESELVATPAGPQPYADFWYNNTWDPDGSYGGPVYGKWGESQIDMGHGTYTWSDFHHNGDLYDYTSPWQITMGKIYGTMDDLRLESKRVQEKYIAMTNALISSVDVDGFRVDTPMQVPLEFFKAWVPAVQEHARSLGKTKFGIFGEFFVEPERYATMTGRGKTPGMYGHDAFIEGAHTMKGGIDYTYYWYIFTALVTNRGDFANGLPLAYDAENQMLDLIEPSSGQPEFAMWTFCNNHDNWRMQVMAGKEQMQLCLKVISFWPGTPLHYAGDEQDFNTPGSALDGWAREELSASMAWRSLPTSASGNPADTDSFDMASDSYRFVQRLNLLRQAYFGEFGSPECDRLETPLSGFADVLTFWRGCDAYGRVLVAANFHSQETRTFKVATPWPETTVLRDIVPEAKHPEFIVGLDGEIELTLRPLQAFVMAAGAVRAVPPTVAEVSPRHGAVRRPGDAFGIRLRFDRAMEEQSARSAIRFNGERPPAKDVECVTAGAAALTDARGCMEFHIHGRALPVQAGIHHIEVDEGVRALDGSTTFHAFRSIFFVEEEPGPLTRPGMVQQPGLICNYFTQLCHSAPGARWMRIMELGGKWTEWLPYQPVSPWQATPGRTVIVQYHAEGSASRIVADCVLHRQERCRSSWHGEMFLRTDMNEWGMLDEGRMTLIDDFSWAVNASFDQYVNAKFAPFPNWDKSYGKQKAREMRYLLPTFDPRAQNFLSDPFYDGTEAIRKYMVDNNLWPEDHSIATGADSASSFWLSHLCNQVPPYHAGFSDTDWQCHPYMASQDTEWCKTVGEDADYFYLFNNRSQYMGDCGTCDCCRKVKPPSVSAVNRTCCIIFNDLYLNYTVTDDLSRCAAKSVIGAPLGPQKGSLISADVMAIFWIVFPLAVAAVGVARKRNRSVVRMRFSPDQVRRVSGVARIWTRSLTSESASAMASESTMASDSSMSQEVAIMKPERVLFASLEHVIEHSTGREKAIAGGLGKVAGLMCRYHPGALICVTATMPGKDYDFAEVVGNIKATVSGTELTVTVMRYEVAKSPSEQGSCPDDGGGPPTITYYLMDHPIFREREDIYPAPQTARRTLEFYSLWCQSVARIIDLEAPDVFHCPDFHGAMAVMYIERPLPILLVLHNAEYQGSISTQHMGRREARHLADVFNLPPERIRKETFIEGKFCMLKPIVDYARRYQHGYGICAVSRNYALEASLKHTVLWGLPELRGIENCMPESERMASAKLSDRDEFADARATAKAFIQEKYGLREDPNARIFVFLGRWVKQKGVDYIADVAEWMLSTYPNAQLLMIGPVGDCFGSYAKAKFESIREGNRFQDSLFVYADFLIVPQELKLACDFCLMPSRDEPFGYVDIEFAWFGASIVGSLRGGLGKLPGFYFQILNADSPSHMQEALRNAIADAMACPADVLAQMAQRAKASAFPVPTWQSELLQAYELVLLKFFSRTASAGLPPLTPRDISDGNEANRCQEDGAAKGECAERELAAGVEFLRQEASEKEMQELVEAKLAKVTFSNASSLIEKVEWERELSQERTFVSRFLGKVILGAPIMDWVICLCYMSGPLIPALTLANVTAQDGEVFAVLRPLTQAMALVFWTVSACIVSPNLLMFLALLLRCVSLFLPFWDHSAILAAIVLGVVGSSDYLFLYYSFMGSSVGDVATLAMRTGMIMAVREQWEPLFMVLEDTPHRVQVGLTAFLGTVFVILPAIALLHAPVLYRVFSVPEISYTWVRKLRFLKLFAGATVLEAFSQTAGTALLKIRQMEPFELTWVRGYCFLLAAVAALTMVLFSLCLRRWPSYAVVLVKAFACCSLPAAILQCYAEVEVDRAYQLTVSLDVLIFVSTMVGALSLYAGAVAVLATVGSRWRFVSYACAVGACTSIARAASFYVLQFATGQRDVMHESRGLPVNLAKRLLFIVVPASGLALLMRFIAFFFFENEATGMLRTWRHRSLMRLALSRQVELLEKAQQESVIKKISAEKVGGAGFGFGFGARPADSN